MPFTPADETEIQHLYFANELTLEKIGARYGRSPAAIAKLAHRRGWPKRHELAGTARRSQIVIARALEEVLMRMCGAMNAKLEQMEKGMQTGEVSSEEFERDAKAVAAMATVTQKALAASTDAKKECQPKSSEPLAPADEVERLQREIMERFERLQRRRNSEAGPE